MLKMEQSEGVNLWAAVMEACHYSVNEKKTKTIVISAENVFGILSLLCGTESV
jgi:hypothetical protein